MFSGVALAESELPAELVERSRVHVRGVEAEVRFLLRDAVRLLPVWLDGRIQLIRWGNRRGQSKALPFTAWTRLKTLEDGQWGDRHPEQVVIPATMILDRGVWFPAWEGVRGVVVKDEQGIPIVYPILVESTHYYQIMTKSPWMPALVGELI
jgi:hypothetical protein